MPEIRRDWPAVARLNRRHARFSRWKRSLGRYTSCRASEDGSGRRFGGACGYAVPFRAVARMMMNCFGKGPGRRSGRQPSEYGLEGLRPMAVPPEPQVLASAVVAVNGRNVHQRQDDRAQPDSLRPLRAALRLDLERGLTDSSEDIERERRKGEDERVRSVVPARKPLDVHVRLELAVELLARGVVVIEPDDRVRVLGEVRPPRRRRVSRKQLVVALHALHLPDAEEGPLLRRRRVQVRDDAAEHVNTPVLLVAIGIGRLAMLSVRLLDPRAHVLVPRVALDDEVESAGLDLPADLVVQVEAGCERVVGVMRGIEADEDPAAVDPADEPDASAEEGGELLLRVLVAGPQFVGELIANASERGEDRGEAVDPVVGEADALLSAVVVDEDGHVDVERNPFASGCLHESKILDLGEKFDVCVVNPLPRVGKDRKIREALAERRLGRNRASDRIREKIVLQVGGDVAEGRLAKRHQRDFRLGDARIGVSLAGERLLGRLAAVELAEGRDGIENLLGEKNPGVAVDILRRFFYNASHNLLVCGVVRL